MGRRISGTTASLTLLAALTALLLASVPAVAHHKDGHSKGPAASSDDGDNAHPSGKDRSVENGSSGNQGSSESDPDDDGRGPDRSNGGADKPNGAGGVDKADQDGNNGCGNDDDFEDDNEGWCGRKPKPAAAVDAATEVEPAAAPCDADATMTGTQPCLDEDVDVAPAEPCVDEDTMVEGAQECSDEDVLGGVIARAATPDQAATQAAAVLGERLAQPAEDGGVGAAPRGTAFQGAQLPFTGSALLSFGAVAVGLLLAGAGILAARRNV